MSRLVVALVALLAVTCAFAEQFRRVGDLEVHYAVVNTSFFDPAILSNYDIEPGKDRAIVNVSVLSAVDQPLQATITGTTMNLLGHTEALEFREIRERDSVYYLAPLRFTDHDTLRFKLTVTVGDRPPANVEFQQQMFVDP